MNPRPIHRWKSFWLGLCVLVFLAWACYFSMISISGVSWRHFEAFHGGGGALLGYDSGNLGGFRAFHEKRRIRVEIGEVEFPGGGNARKLTLPFDDDGASPWVKPIGYAGNGQMAVFLPHWSTLLIMAALWSTWLLCHWKREQKKRNP